jgi:hypothetical protein
MKGVILLLLMGLLYQDASRVLFNGTKSNSLTDWYVVDDGVMGGRSKGSLTLNDAGNIHYTGIISLKNNGGFSSIRYNFSAKDVSKYTFVVLKIKGDGSRYQFRIKRATSDRYSYVKNFETSGSWESIKMPLNSFYPSFRGNTLDQPNYSGRMMEEIGILIGNKQAQGFSLEIEEIYLE